MIKSVRKELLALGIDTVGALPLTECRIIRDHKLKRCGFESADGVNVIIFAIPYYTEHKNKNISSYAVPRDYHLFCRLLFESLLPRLRAFFPNNGFFGFADDSPIAERDAAAKAGLGIIGDNGLLITEKYSSYVFLAEIITDLPIDTEEVCEIRRCEGCGACKNACPVEFSGECLSSITQKKGELLPNEIAAIKMHGLAWGCDICQEVCPHTASAKDRGTIYTPIDFFKADLIPELSSELVKGMTDAVFSARAYSWRKKETILRNLAIIETENHNGTSKNSY